MTSPILGIDTSSTSCSAALLHEGATFVRRETVGNGHSGRILDMVRAVFSEADVPLADCAAVAFSAGPGAFTGLRVGCAVAQGLAFGIGCPVVPVGTLEAIGVSLANDDLLDGTILVAQDARMNEVYWSVLVADTGRVTVRIPPALTAATALRAALRDVACPSIDVGCGNAWSLHPEALAGLTGRVVHRETADAVDIARLGRDAFVAGHGIPADRAAPIYVRDQVALTTREREAMKAQAVPA